MKKYRVVFIGNRPLIFTSLLSHSRLEVVKSFIVKGSLIENMVTENREISICGSSDSAKVIDFLKYGEYDLCISAGCPYILPISSLPSDKVFINSHPSVLPLGRGKHPINECILATHKKAGSTLHYLVDDLDAGDIIHQESFDVTDDLDVEVLYSFIFDFEFNVFIKGLDKLIACDLSYCGHPQVGDTTYFSRNNDALSVCIENISIYSLLRKIRAFANSSLGVRTVIDNREVIIFSSKAITNGYVNERFSDVPIGSAIFWNETFILLKLKDGIIKIDKWTSL